MFLHSLSQKPDMHNHDKNDQRLLLNAFRHTLDVVKP